MSLVMTWGPVILAMLAAGLFAGYTAGLFGVGGGFVVVPAMVALLPLLGGAHSEYTHVAIGTSAATIIITSIRSLRSHAKRGAVEWEILKAWAPGLVIGAAIGVALADRIDGRGLTLIFGIGVLLMSLNFLLPKVGDKVIGDQMPRGAPLAAISGGLGLFSALLGIGGGTIAIMVMTLCGRTIHRAIATASGIGTLIAVPTAIGFAIIGWKEPQLPWGSFGYVNLPAAFVITATSVLTAPFGVATAHRLPSGPLKRVFGVYLLVIGGFMLRRALKM